MVAVEAVVAVEVGRRDLAGGGVFTRMGVMSHRPPTKAVRSVHSSMLWYWGAAARSGGSTDGACPLVVSARAYRGEVGATDRGGTKGRRAPTRPTCAYNTTLLQAAPCGRRAPRASCLERCCRAPR